MYSPEVFAIAQLLGELPYSIPCAIVYWAIMVMMSDTIQFNLPTYSCRSTHRVSVEVQLGWAELGYNWWSSFS
jgi:hypothetical protein